MSDGPIFHPGCGGEYAHNLWPESGWVCSVCGAAWDGEWASYRAMKKAAEAGSDAKA